MLQVVPSSSSGRLSWQQSKSCFPLTLQLLGVISSLENYRLKVTENFEIILLIDCAMPFLSLIFSKFLRKTSKISRLFSPCKFSNIKRCENKQNRLKKTKALPPVKFKHNTFAMRASSHLNIGRNTLKTPRNTLKTPWKYPENTLIFWLSVLFPCALCGYAFEQTAHESCREGDWLATARDWVSLACPACTCNKKRRSWQISGAPKAERTQPH